MMTTHSMGADRDGGTSPDAEGQPAPESEPAADSSPRTENGRGASSLAARLATSPAEQRAGLEADVGRSGEGATRQLMSLTDCLDRLSQRHDLGRQAPAHVTLKRWSAAGRLDRAKVVKEGGRPIYDLALVREICLEQLAGRFSPPLDEAGSEGSPTGSEGLHGGPPREVAGQPHTGTPASHGMQIVELGALMDRVGHLEQSVHALTNQFRSALGDVTTQLARCAQACEGLDAVRRSLQVRTDGELTSLRDHLGRTQSELARARDLGAAPTLMQIGIAIKAISERLEDVWRDRPSERPADR